MGMGQRKYSFNTSKSLTQSAASVSQKLTILKKSYMKRILLLIFVFIFGLAVDGTGQTDIYLQDYKIYIAPKKCKDSIMQYLVDSSSVKINLLNCKGKMNIKEFDRSGVLLVTGQYEGSLDTLKEYVDVFDIFGELKAIEVHKYFQPIKNGVWTYYENGAVKKKEKYNLGVLIKE
jgi:hypothetical protein